MCVHLTMLVIQSLIDLFYSIFWLVDSENSSTEVGRFAVIACIIPLQIAICYICYTVGSNEKLKKFNAEIRQDGDRIQLQFTRHESNFAELTSSL